MKAMVLSAPGEPLRYVERVKPAPAKAQIGIRVSACGVCRTDLHIVDGELPQCRYPIVPGHEIVGTIDRLGSGVSGFDIGERVGVPWLGATCGHCRFCHAGAENLCDEAHFTGCQIDGGYQEYCLADARFCFPLPEKFSDVEAAPLLCAGLIGHRAHRMAGEAERIGIYGFGAAAHILALPDAGLITMTEMVENIQRICNAVNIPVMADCDTGFGNAVNVRRTVQAVIQAGAAGLFMDQI